MKNTQEAPAEGKAQGGRKHDIDMTEGSIVKLLIQFALPLLVGNLFQQLYNTVDSYVVGRVSNEAFAAVGSVGPIINTAVGFFSGFATGAGVVISHFIGSKDDDSVSDTVQTSIVVTVILAVLFTVAGYFLVPEMITLMQTPEGVVSDAVSYLQIYFLGLGGLMLYNMAAGIFRAAGNSTLPLAALIISAVINTVLDVVFVLFLDFGVAGAAYATIIAEAISALFLLAVLTVKDTAYKIRWTKLKIAPEILKRIIYIGFPAALQMAITSFSNVFVQSYINTFGENFMSGWTAYSKIDAFALLPMQSISLSVTTFTGQNYGAGLPERAKRGTFIGIMISLAVTALLIVPIIIFAEPLVAFLNSEPAVVEYGAMLLRAISPFYLMCVINQILAGTLRGAGNSKTPMFIMLGSFVLFRQIYLIILTHFSSSIYVIVFAYPAGWVLCSLLMLLYYKFSGWEKKIPAIAGT
ncbi:MAG: MATE family efflux transporter [Clostridiales bacterium]|nr:MATE family efflux transporter [Clostridiales bacterium]